GGAIRTELVDLRERCHGDARLGEIRRGARVRFVQYGRRRSRSRDPDPRACRLVSALPRVLPISLEPSPRAGEVARAHRLPARVANDAIAVSLFLPELG